MNDDVTPMGFVVAVLEQIFNYDMTKSHEIMLKIHNKGSAVVGVFDYSTAETKKNITDKWSKQYNYPLVVKIEKDK